MRRKFLISICVAIFLFTPVFVSANVVINEVKYGESGKATNEFVELYNTDVDIFNINNWKLYKYTKLSTTTPDRILIADISSASIPALGYFLIAHGDYAFVGETESPDLTYAESSLSANNTVLLCKEDDSVVDEVGYGDATAFEGLGPANDPNNQSIERRNGVDNNDNSSDFAITAPSPRNKLFVLAPVETPTTTPTSTPPDETPTTTPTTTAFAVTPPLKINEFLPNPSSGEEWVEIYNPTTSSIIIDGLKLFDSTTERAAPTGTIDGLGFFIIELSDKLNNDGDTITLKDSSDVVIDKISYTDVEKGNSIARSVDGVGSFVETTSLTRGAMNIITAPVVIVPTNNGGGGGGGGSNYVAPPPVVTTPDIVINELVSDPTDGAVEFVELYNKTNNTVSLAGWWIEEGSGSRNVLNGSIAPLGFFVLEKPSGSLNNAGDIVRLVSSDGKEVDKVVYGNWNDGSVSNNAVVASDPFSLARKIDGYDTNNDHSNFVITAQITKGGPNVVVSVTQFSSTTTSSTPIQNLEEKEENTLPMISILLPEEIVVGEPVEFDASETIDLEEDELSFAWDFGDGSHAYGETVLHEYKEDGTFTISLVVKDGVGQSKETAKVKVSQLLSNSVNEVVETRLRPASYAGQARTATKGSYWGLVGLDKMGEVGAGDKVKVSGTVAVLPNVFGSQYFYITNSSNGVQVYMNTHKFPELKIGDVVEVAGEISEPYGEKRVKVKNATDIRVIGHTDNVLPAELTTVDLSESVGAFVKLKGEITEMKSTYLYIDDGEGEVKVVFKRGANIGKGSWQIGDLVEIMGVVGQSSSGIQLMPRSQMDIVKVGHVEDLSVSSEQAKNETTETYLTATVGGLTSILISLAAKARGKMAVGLLKRVGGLAMLVVKRKTRV